MDKKHLNSRGTKRIKLERPVFFSIHESMGKEVRLKEQAKILKGITKNINAKGVAIETDMFLPFGTLLDINIDLEKEAQKTGSLTKSTSPLKVLGKIAVVKSVAGGKYKMGIVFVKIEDKDKKIIEDYVKENI